MFHHPPGGSDNLILSSRWFKQIVLKYKDTIILQLAGHTHFDEFRLVCIKLILMLQK